MTEAVQQTAAAEPGGLGPPGAVRALALATLTLMVNFWAWNLLAPLAPRYAEQLSLSPFEVSLLVSVPVLVGSLGRIPLGALTDRFGGRIMFAIASYVAIAPVVFLATAQAYPALLVGGFLLGVSGATFAIGVPYVTPWVHPERRGMALGVYGAGNIGTAVSGFVSPSIARSLGRPWAFLAVAVALAVVGTLFLVIGREAPGRTPATEPFGVRFLRALRLPVARDLALLYAITFGGFVAFGAYLPTYLAATYDIATADAAFRAAGFVVVATVFRPVGGWLSDRIDGARVLAWALGIVAVGAIVTAFAPPLPAATVAFLSMAAALGLGNGAIFALLGRRVPVPQVGSVTGLVGAAGGLGGFLPPLVMGAVSQATGSYAIGLMLLSDVAFAGLVYTLWRFLSSPGGETVGPARPTPR
jgi:NNP family nitrate/nitrite transporter-like MFS transporter